MLISNKYKSDLPSQLRVGFPLLQGHRIIHVEREEHCFVLMHDIRIYKILGVKKELN